MLLSCERKKVASAKGAVFVWREKFWVTLAKGTLPEKRKDLQLSAAEWMKAP